MGKLKCWKNLAALELPDRADSIFNNYIGTPMMGDKAYY